MWNLTTTLLTQGDGMATKKATSARAAFDRETVKLEASVCDTRAESQAKVKQ
ncbi:hypothetical protein [Paraburkholderia sp. JPY419]|uniref:hypothetical protein n=1 Tax=Paraburkholderia sp. JPY419 TaxID=667660 RepID=UPI003D25AB27